MVWLRMTDEEWAVLEPLINECRPPCKVPIKNLRQRIEGILWRHENGAKWRAMPAEYGPWWKPAQTFIDRSRLGVWERLLERVRARLGVALGMAFLDGTAMRAHQKAAGAAKKGELQRNAMIVRPLAAHAAALGPKPLVIADGKGRAVAFAVAPGQAHEVPLAPGLIDKLPAAPGWIVGDRGLSAHALRELIWDSGAKPAIPPKRNEAPVACRSWIYQNRNIVERLWARLKEWRAVATRYEKTRSSFQGVLCLAATFDWIRG